MVPRDNYMVTEVYFALHKFEFVKWYLFLFPFYGCLHIVCWGSCSTPYVRSIVFRNLDRHLLCTTDSFYFLCRFSHRRGDISQWPRGGITSVTSRKTKRWAPWEGNSTEKEGHRVQKLSDGYKWNQIPETQKKKLPVCGCKGQYAYVRCAFTKNKRGCET